MKPTVSLFLALTRALTRALTLALTLALILAPVLAAAPARAGVMAGLEAYDGGDYETVLREWLPEAEAGNATIQAILGTMYRNGEGIPRDYGAALKWLGRAAGQGEPSALFMLGLMHGAGQGVAADRALAFMYFDLAAARGHAAAKQRRDQLAATMTEAEMAVARVRTPRPPRK